MSEIREIIKANRRAENARKRMEREAIEHKIVKTYKGYEAESVFDSWKDEPEQAECSCGKNGSLHSIKKHVEHFRNMGASND